MKIAPKTFLAILHEVKDSQIQKRGPKRMGGSWRSILHSQDHRTTRPQQLDKSLPTEFQWAAP